MEEFFELLAKIARDLGIEVPEDVQEFFLDEFAPEGLDDPIVALMDQSGPVSGSWTAEQCGVIAPRLRALASKWPASDPVRKGALALADAMESCAGGGDHLDLI